MCSIKVIVEIFWYDPKWSSDRTHQKSLIQPLKVEVSGTIPPLPLPKKGLRAFILALL